MYPYQITKQICRRMKNSYLFVIAFIDTDMAPSNLQIIKSTIMFWLLLTTMVVKGQDFSDINANR